MKLPTQILFLVHTDMPRIILLHMFVSLMLVVVNLSTVLLLIMVLLLLLLLPYLLMLLLSRSRTRRCVAIADDFTLELAGDEAERRVPIQPLK